MAAIEREITDAIFEEMLDEIYGDRDGCIEICGMRYSAGRALKEIDPVAFRCGKADMPTEYECSECGKFYGDDEEAAEACCPAEESTEESDSAS